jgi:hypothetical protein
MNRPGLSTQNEPIAPTTALDSVRMENAARPLMGWLIEAKVASREFEIRRSNITPRVLTAAGRARSVETPIFGG